MVDEPIGEPEASGAVASTLEPQFEQKDAPSIN